MSGTIHYIFVHVLSPITFDYVYFSHAIQLLRMCAFDGRQWKVKFCAALSDNASIDWKQVIVHCVIACDYYSAINLLIQCLLILVFNWFVDCSKFGLCNTCIDDLYYVADRSVLKRHQWKNNNCKWEILLHASKNILSSVERDRPRIT